MMMNDDGEDVTIFHVDSEEKSALAILISCSPVAIIVTVHVYMLRPDLKSVARFKTGWPDLKWASPF